MANIKNGKKIITALLGLSCIISGIILASTPAPVFYRLETVGQLDSLLQEQFDESRLMPSEIQSWTVKVDSLLSRREFRIKVPSHFSKTKFHIELDKKLGLYGFDTPAKVHFPSRDMNIYVYHDNTVLRTLRLTTDPELDSLQTQ